MFTDLVGSTEIRSRVGEDAAEALRVIHDQVLTDAIAANGGQVIKHLGDGMMATFTSAAGAIAAAVAMHQQLDLRNRRFGAADRLLALLHDALGESDRADGYFARAVEQHHRLRSPTWVARTELDWAESLIARDRFDDAREHLAAAEAAIGDLDLADSTRRLAALRARL
jgi:tetratricopeptide (TPR) repeat protein